LSAPAFTWHPIEDLPLDHVAWASQELPTLAQVWAEQKGSLGGSGALEAFLQRLTRRWAIETGVIENVYSLDRGTTQVLIEHGIKASLIPHDATNKDTSVVASIISDQKAAIDWLFDFVKGHRRLSVSYIKELHALLTRHQDACDGVDSLGRRVQVRLERGIFKRLPNNPTRENGSIHEYCPPSQVDAEMERLVALHHLHEELRVPAEVEAAWLHHRFAQIHPFQDGNGRIARALATLVLIRVSWFPIVVSRDDQAKYIRNLEIADSGNLRPLVEYFALLEKREFLSALSIARDVQEELRIEQAIAAAKEALVGRRSAQLAAWSGVEKTARRLQETVEAECDVLAKDLRTELGSISEQYKFSVLSEPHGGGSSHYYSNQIVATAKTLGYFANTGVYRAWVRLALRAEGQGMILFSFHAVGSEFRGVMAVSACFFRRHETEGGQVEVADFTPLCEEPFQMNYLETEAKALERFRPWLERCLARGLEVWRAGF
jgi:fido (protein-threonine AMPylation protein)